MNNKAYALTTLLILFVIFITLAVFLLKVSLRNQADEASFLLGVMDKAYFNYSKELLFFVNSFKASAYGNLSNSSTFGSFLEGRPSVNNPTFDITFPGYVFGSGTVNMSFPSKELNVTVHYNLLDLVNASLIVNSTVAGSGILACEPFMVNSLNVEPVSFCSCGEFVTFSIFNSSDAINVLYPFFSDPFFIRC